MYQICILEKLGGPTETCLAKVLQEIVSDAILHSTGRQRKSMILEFHEASGAYHIYAGHKRRVKVVCPETGEGHSMYDHREERTWRQTDINEPKCYILLSDT